MQMGSWVVERPGQPMVYQIRDEVPQPDEVLVKVAACGVCHTDLGFFYDGVPTRHPFPLTLGHEISGTVVDAGPDALTWIGARVVVPAVIPCGVCPACRAGRGQVCPKQVFPGNDVHGGFGTHVRVPARGLCRFPDLADTRINKAGLALDALAVIADAVSTPYAACVRAQLSPGDLAVWVGVGGVGGFGVQISSALGATVVAIDLSAERLAQMALHGATLTLNSGQSDPKSIRKAIRDFAQTHDIPSWRMKIFESSGHPSGQALAFGLLGPGATLSVVGYTSVPVEVRLSNLMAFDAVAMGNWGCLPELYPAVVDLALSGRIAIEPFVDRRPLSSINDVFQELHHGSARGRIALIPEA
jgi:6-hydroxycyclohex-1-ene-1-carbonyl-CoA dehydrogenase